MCGRFTLSTSRRVIERRFGVDLLGLRLKPRYNIAPGDDVLSVVAAKEGHRRPILMRWGLRATRSEPGRAESPDLNARIETADTDGVYRASFQRSRCLIVADGFYQWKREPAVTRYWIGRSDAAPFAFAGLYSVRRALEGRPELYKCAILTEPASHTLERVHDRMPVILHPDRWDAWLDLKRTDPGAVRDVLESDPSALRFHRVSARLDSTDNDDPELVREVD